MQILRYVLPLLLLGHFTNYTIAQKYEHPNASEIDIIFQEWDKPTSPGLALGVFHDGKIVFSKGYGSADLEHDVPITPSTVFYTGSVSKQFVTMCILLLEEEGLLDLDAEIQTYLPDFPRYEHPLTIRNFVHHTSGVRDYLTLWNLAGNDFLDAAPEEAFYEMIKRQKELNFTPGERYLYSNSCYFMLSMIIEKVSGKSLKDYAQENILGPLNMSNSHFHDDHTHIIKDRAFSYRSTEDGYENIIMRFDQVGSGGLYSTIEDLFKWDQNFYKNTLGKGGPQLIDKMEEEGLLNNGESTNYAFALRHGDYRGLKTIGHTGSLAGYRAVMTRFPDQNLTVAILSNIMGFQTSAKAMEVVDIFLKDDLGPVEKEDNQSIGSTGSGTEAFIVSDLSQYTGTYYSKELNTRYHFEIENDTLQIKVKYNSPIKLRPTAKDRFRRIVEIRFVRDNDGNITGFILDAGRVQNLKFEKIN
ncbi:MAG: beta-lactamase family protein [Bacteroidia bacterium]|nr:beta-lactamase family protein [Bacteroidia bacterium]